MAFELLLGSLGMKKKVTEELELEKEKVEDEALEALEAEQMEAEMEASEEEVEEEAAPKPRKRSPRKKVSDNPAADLLDNSVTPLLKEVSEIQARYITLNEQTETLLKNIQELQKNAIESLEKAKEPTFKKVNTMQKFSVVGVTFTFVLAAITFLMTQSIRKEVFQMSVVQQKVSEPQKFTIDTAPLLATKKKVSTGKK